MIFRYKSGNSIFHKLNPSVKIILILPISILIMKFSMISALCGIIILSVFAFLCGFSIKEQISDLSPAKYYFFILYVLSFITNLIENFSFSAFIPDISLLSFVLRLALMMQMCALIFRTSTSMQIREAIENIETCIRKVLRKIPVLRHKISQENRFSTAVSLFMSFIPAEFELWGMIDRSWKARGGKNGIKKIKTLSFVFMSISFYKADKKAKAISARI